MQTRQEREKTPPKGKRSDETASICDSIAFGLTDSHASTRAMEGVPSPPVWAREVEDDVFTRTSRMGSLHPNRDKRPRGPNRPEAQSARSSYNPHTGSVRASVARQVVVSDIESEGDLLRRYRHRVPNRTTV